MAGQGVEGVVAIKISVVTASYNSAATIKESLLSVAAQTYPAIEHVIVDGASKDDTLKVVKECSVRGASIVSEADHGIYDAWNKGVRRATGDYIWLLNSDDRIYDPDTIKDAVDFLAAHASPAFVYGKVKGTEKESGYSYIAGRRTDLRDFIYGMRDFCILSTIIRKDVFNKIGYFSTGYRISSDYEWAIKLFKSLPPDEIVFYDRILTDFSVGGVSNLRYKEAYREVAQIVKAHFSLRDFILHKLYMAWRLSLMGILPYARSVGLLAAWRKIKSIANYAG